MLDIKFVRENPEVLDVAMANRQGSWDRDRFFALDEERRSVISQVEDLQATRNAESKKIGMLMKEGKREEAEAAKEAVRQVNEQIEGLAARRSELDAEVSDFMARIPNIPCEATPVGKDENENPERRRVGEPRDFAAEGFDPKAHWDLGTETGILDFDRGAKLSGARFTVLSGAGATLDRALQCFFLNTHIARGFKEFIPPVIVNREIMYGTGQLPKFEDDAYHTGEDQFLIPTAEVALTNLHAGEVLDASQLPLRYTAGTPCFREEAGSAGRDTRGIIRQHQFTKVEMVKFARPEESDDELESMVAEAEYLLQQLGLPYRVISLCTGCPGLPRPPDVRHRGLAAELQRLQGDLLLLQLRRLPGPPCQHQVPRPRELQGHALRAHPQWLRPAHRPHDGCHHGELPECGRLHHGARGPALLHGRHREDRAAGVGGWPSSPMERRRAICATSPSPFASAPQGGPRCSYGRGHRRTAPQPLLFSTSPYCALRSHVMKTPPISRVQEMGGGSENTCPGDPL